MQGSDNIERLEEKIDLFEIFTILLKWKYLIIFFVVGFTIYTWIVFDYLTDVYTARAVLKIGSFAGIDLEKKQDIGKRLGEKVELEYVRGNLVIKYSSIDPDIAYTFVRETTEELVEYHKNVFQKAIHEMKVAQKEKLIRIDPKHLLDTYNYQTELLIPAKKPLKPIDRKIMRKTIVTMILSLLVGAIFSYLAEHLIRIRTLQRHNNPT